MCKNLSKYKAIFWSFMDLEKVLDTINQHGMWQKLKVCGVEEKLLNSEFFFM